MLEINSAEAVILIQTRKGHITNPDLVILITSSIELKMNLCLILYSRDMKVSNPIDLNQIGLALFNRTFPREKESKLMTPFYLFPLPNFESTNTNKGDQALVSIVICI